MRIKPRICVGETCEIISLVVQKSRAIITRNRRPLHCELRSDVGRRCSCSLRDSRLVVDVINPKIDAMLNAASLDDCQSYGLAIVAVLALAIEHVTHCEDGLERVAL